MGKKKKKNTLISSYFRQATKKKRVNLNQSKNTQSKRQKNGARGSAAGLVPPLSPIVAPVEKKLENISTQQDHNSDKENLQKDALQKFVNTVTQTEKIQIPSCVNDSVMYEPKGNSRKDAAFGKSRKDLFYKEKHKYKVLKHVLDNFIIPSDFDTSLTLKYGSRSGVCYEDRVLFCFENGIFVAKKEKNMNRFQEKMCHLCGKQGHFPPRCPEAFL